VCDDYNNVEVAEESEVAKRCSTAGQKEMAEYRNEIKKKKNKKKNKKASVVRESNEMMKRDSIDSKHKCRTN